MSLRLYIPPKTEEQLNQIESILDGAFEKSEIVKLAVFEYYYKIISVKPDQVKALHLEPNQRYGIKDWDEYWQSFKPVKTEVLSDLEIDDLVYGSNA